MTAHLRPDMTNRGFAHLPEILGAYGGKAQVYESSAASGPHVWLKVQVPLDLNRPVDGEDAEATLHLTAENASRLSEQLAWIVANHYQGGGQGNDLASGLGR